MSRRRRQKIPQGMLRLDRQMLRAPRRAQQKAHMMLLRGSWRKMSISRTVSLRALADAENVRRRAERELNDMRQYAVTRFAGDMVNVADNLERAMSSLPAKLRGNAGPFKTFVEGVELTEKELLRSLEAHGVKKLDPTGSRFDPHFHEAMFQVQDPSVPSGTVTTVVQPGYAIGSRSLRPAKVGVAG